MRGLHAPPPPASVFSKRGITQICYVPIPTIHPQGYRPVHIHTPARRGAFHCLRNAPRRAGGRGARRNLYRCVVVDCRDDDIGRLISISRTLCTDEAQWLHAVAQRQESRTMGASLQTSTEILRASSRVTAVWSMHSNTGIFCRNVPNSGVNLSLKIRFLGLKSIVLTSKEQFFVKNPFPRHQFSPVS